MSEYTKKKTASVPVASNEPQEKQLDLSQMVDPMGVFGGDIKAKQEHSEPVEVNENSLDEAIGDEAVESTQENSASEYDDEDQSSSETESFEEGSDDHPQASESSDFDNAMDLEDAPDDDSINEATEDLETEDAESDDEFDLFGNDDAEGDGEIDLFGSIEDQFSEDQDASQDDDTSGHSQDSSSNDTEKLPLSAKNESRQGSSVPSRNDRSDRPSGSYFDQHPVLFQRLLIAGCMLVGLVTTLVVYDSMNGPKSSAIATNPSYNTDNDADDTDITAPRFRYVAPGEDSSDLPTEAPQKGGVSARIEALMNQQSSGENRR